MTTTSVAELNAQIEQSRSIRQQLAHERCGAQGCGECERKDVMECETCHTFEPRCRLAHTSECVECVPCEAKRAAEFFAEWRRQPEPEPAEFRTVFHQVTE